MGEGGQRPGEGWLMAGFISPFRFQPFSVLIQVDMMATGLLHALWPVLPPNAQNCTV
jgi:hypothetical protein